MEFDRRQFIKFGLAATATIAATGIGGVLGHTLGGRHVSRTTSNFHFPVDTACRMCPAGCGIRAYVDNYKNLVMLGGIPGHPVNNGKICAKGMAAINLHYHPERLLSPLATTSRRGEGYKGISISDSVRKAADLIKSAKAKGARFIVDTQDDDPQIYKVLLSHLGVDYQIISRPVAKARISSDINEQVFGWPNVQPDLHNTDIVLVFGANPFEGGDHYIALARALVDAKVENSAAIFVFDPVNTNTAGRAARWLPIKPGTDLFAAGYLLRMVHPTINDLPENPLAALDERTATSLTGLSTEDFKHVARAIRRARKTAIVVGNGIYTQSDAVQTRTALALLESAGKGAPFFAEAGNTDPDKIACPAGQIGEVYERMIHDNDPVFLITRRSNPVYEGGLENLAETLKNRERVIGHISISPFVNETNMLADLILPEALPLEDYGLVRAPWRAVSRTWTIQQPVAKAPDGIQSGYDLLMQIASKIGMAGTVDSLGKTQEERVRNKLAILGLDLNKLNEGNVVYERRPDEAGQPKIPTIESLSPFDISGLNSKKNAENNFTLLIHDTNVMNENLANAKWLSEISHRNPLRINSKDARKLGVRDGDAVRISSGPVSLVASANVCEGVTPGVCSLAAGFGHTDFGKIAKGERWRTDADPDAWLIWWGQYGNGSNANRLTDKFLIDVKLTKV